ncbi:MAG: thermonuclease family protein [bacterium]
MKKSIISMGVIVVFLLLGVVFEILPSPIDKNTNENKPFTQAQLEDFKNTTTYTVKRVIDGDTIELSIDDTTLTVRLIGINTPETKDPRKNVECYGKEASAKMKKIIEGKKVYFNFDESQAQYDKYGRSLLYIWRAEDNLFINEYLIQEGFANEYTYSVPYLYQKQFKEAELKAKKEGRGLWGDICNI